MTSPYRAVVDQVVTWISQEIPESADWTFYVEEPLTLQGTGCAVWWERDDARPEGNTTFTLGGWALFEDTYGIRYWTPAPEQARLTLSEEALALMEQTITDVRNVLFNHTTDLPAPNGELSYRGASKFMSHVADIDFRGFEIAFSVPRRIDYT